MNNIPDYDINNAFEPLQQASQASSELADFEEFLEQGMTHQLKQKLGAKVEEALHPLEAALKSQIVDIIQDIQLLVLREYRGSQSNMRASPTPTHRFSNFEFPHRSGPSMQKEIGRLQQPPHSLPSQEYFNVISNTQNSEVEGHHVDTYQSDLCLGDNVDHWDFDGISLTAFARRTLSPPPSP